jgi:hypothetical protein
MKKLLPIALVLLITAAATTFAGGDKVRGERGKGEVNQVHVRHSEEGTPAYD